MSLTDRRPLSDYGDLDEVLERANRRYHLFDAEPSVPASPDERQALILELAGDLLALDVRDTEWVRREFGRRFGSGEVGPASGQHVDLSRAGEGVVRVTLTLTSARDWDRLRSAGYLAGDDLAGVRGIFRDRRTVRDRWHKAETIVRAVAIHYLSRSGGGTLTTEAAADLYAAAYPSSSGAAWDPGKHAQLLRDLAADFGPLP